MAKLDIEQLKQENKQLAKENAELKNKKGNLADKLAEWWTGANNITRPLFIVATMAALFFICIGIALGLTAILPDSTTSEYVVGVLTAIPAFYGVFTLVKAFNKIL